jgi:hypothetical protein
VQLVRDPLIASRELLEVLRALPEVPDDLGRVLDAFSAEAEVHGLGGVLLHTSRAAGVHVDADVDARMSARAVARELDHAAQLAMLAQIDRAFERNGLHAAVLKGALLGERLYAHPSARGATDIDLLVPEADLDRAIEAIREVGYVQRDDPEEARFRREHHHIHLEHPNAIPLELHFDAYRGFGSVLRGAPLVGRSRRFGALRVVGVLAPEDELLYLMVHAAAHRFGRLSWLYDIKLLIARMTDEELALTKRRAAETGYGHVVSLAAELLEQLAAVPRERTGYLMTRGGVRRALAARVAAEPKHPLARAATRFVYTTALCADAKSAAGYASRASVAYIRRMLSARA